MRPVVVLIAVALFLFGIVVPVRAQTCSISLAEDSSTNVAVAGDQSILVEGAERCPAGQEDVLLSGGGGDETLVLSAGGAVGAVDVLTIDLGSGDDAVVIDGTGANDTFYAGMIDGTVLKGGFVDTGSNVELQDVEALEAVGKGGDDTFSLNGFLIEPAIPTWSDPVSGLEADLRGDGDNDVLDGGDGNDTLSGGNGDDDLFGGGGDDVFDEGTAPNGADDFSGGDGGDLLDYSARTETTIRADSVNGLDDDGDVTANEQDDMGGDVESVECPDDQLWPLAGGECSNVITLGPDETVSTGNDPDPADPVELDVFTPTGGDVTVDDVIPPTVTAPGDWTFLGIQVDIEAPEAASATDPLRLTFRIDASLVPSGGVAEIDVFRTESAGVPERVRDCTIARVEASPDPCVFARDDLPNGDAEITVLTTQASKWNFGKGEGPTDSGGGGSSQGDTDQCEDNMDNDADGWIDYPTDADCSGRNDDTEYWDGPMEEPSPEPTPTPTETPEDPPENTGSQERHFMSIVKIYRSPGVFHGSVNGTKVTTGSTEPTMRTACESRRQVEIFKVRDGKDLRVETATTNSHGVWRRAYRDASGRYYAAVARMVVDRSGVSVVCKADRSRAIRV